MAWYKLAAQANGSDQYVNDAGTLLSAGASPNFYVTLGSSQISGANASGAAAQVVIEDVIAATRERVVDVTAL